MDDEAVLEATRDEPHFGSFAAEHLSPTYPQRAPWGTAQRLRAWQAEALDLYFDLDGPDDPHLTHTASEAVAAEFRDQLGLAREGYSTFDLDSFRAGPNWRYIGLLLALFVAGFINALVHAKDAWAAMPAGLILSVIVLLLAIGAIWAGFSSLSSARRL